MSDNPQNPAPGSEAPAPDTESASGSSTYSPPTQSPAPPAPPAPVTPPPQTPPAWTAPEPAPQPKRERDVRSGGVMGGVILIVLGLIFLAGQIVPGIDIGKLWPLILVAIGIGIIFRRR